jgi:phospholipase A1
MIKFNVKPLVCSILFFLPVMSYAIQHTHSSSKTVTAQPNATSTNTSQTNRLLPKDVEKFMTSLTTEQRSLLEERLEHEQQIAKNPFGIGFYRPTYILPFYYTQTPCVDCYPDGSIPADQTLKRPEFKAQISFKLPIWQSMFGKPFSLYFGYSQLFYWQIYTKSQYFRETNYEPEFFIQHHLLQNWLLNLGIVHESNGRGGDLEKSWNRVYASLVFSGTHWIIHFKPWFLIFKAQSSDIHNPDISRYLGHLEFLVAYKFYKGHILSLRSRNNFESGFKRGAVQVNYSFPLHGHVKGFLQIFSGYGQSLIEYNHYTNAIGVGISLNDWV